MGRRRVPEKDSDFDAYINNTSKVLESGLPNGAVRLGLSTNEKDQWLAYRDEWNILYPKYRNQNERTKTIKQSKNKLKEDFTRFAVAPLNKISGSSNLTNDDRAVFRLPQRGSTHSRRGAMHENTPVGSLHSMGGARIKVRARIEDTVGRPRKHPLSDAVEMKYMFVEIGKNFLNPRVTEDDCTLQHISKKAMFIIDAGQQNLGKRMLAFMRWVNFSNPSHNSGWCNVMNVVVG